MRADDPVCPDRSPVAREKFGWEDEEERRGECGLLAGSCAVCQSSPLRPVDAGGEAGLAQTHAPRRCAPAPFLRLLGALQVSGNLVRDCMYPNNDFKTLPQLQVSDWTRRGDKGLCSPADAGAEIRAALLG